MCLVKGPVVANCIIIISEAFSAPAFIMFGINFNIFWEISIMNHYNICLNYS